ncbi:MAG: hypothetical protein K2Y39_20090 [Candidatus Obscuribacterales bacterium]|nr:hypothetical protein [Candidatus Obscuribacterales bacterium]
MPKFPPECIQRLRDAGLEVHNRSYDELEDPEVNDYQGRLIVIHEHHRLWMFSHEKHWCVEYYGPNAGDFLTKFDTPEEAVASALVFFAGDERWKAVEDSYQYANNTLPSRVLEKASENGLRWERKSDSPGYKFFLETHSTSVRVCRGRTDEFWTTIYDDEEPKTESKHWPTAEEAVNEVIRFMSDF